MSLTIVLVCVLIGLLFSFMNGMNDAANCIATVIATRALSPVKAVIWAAFWQFSAAFIFPVAVATMMGEGIVNSDCIDEYVILACLLGSVFWIWFCTKMGLPISASHAMIGGLIGPVWFGFGWEHLVLSGIGLILLFIVLSPLLGAIMGFAFNCIFLKVFKNSNALKVNRRFMKFQLFSSAAFSLGYGGNDGQKMMGIIAILLCSYVTVCPNDFIGEYFYHPGQGFYIPVWLVFTCYAMISLGTITGGWKVIRTLGDGLTKVTPVPGFCSELSGALTLIITALGGIPVSTTHTITGSIIGTGLTRGVNCVKWVTAKNIVWAWILTIPAVIVVSGLFYLALKAIFI